MIFVLLELFLFPSISDLDIDVFEIGEAPEIKKGKVASSQY